MLFANRILVREQECFFHVIDKRKHEIIIEILAQEFVEFFNGIGGQFFAVTKREIISKRKIVGHRLFAAFLKHLFEMFKWSNASRIILHFAFCLLCVVCRNLKLVCDFHDLARANVFVHGIFCVKHNISFVSRKIGDSVLFDVEKQIFHVFKPRACVLASVVECSFKFDMIALKRIEILHSLRVFNSLFGFFVNAHGLVHGIEQSLHHTVEGFARLFSVGAIFENHCLGELHAYTVDRIERGKRILEYHRDFVAAKLVEVFLVNLKKIHAVVQNLTAFNDCVWSGYTDNRLVRDRFSGAGFTDDCERFALVQIKVYTANGLHFAGIRTE